MYRYISQHLFFQVFFCVLIGTFSIGNITPHLTAIAGAKGAAAVLIDIIDNVNISFSKLAPLF
jgi:hypothetical protein